MDTLRNEGTWDDLDMLEEPETVVVFPVHHPEFYRNEKLVMDKGLNRTDVIARAKAMGLRDYRDRVILAVQDDDLRPEMGGLFSRTDVDCWIEAELAVDRHEDENMLTLAQARALAKETGLDDYSTAVLNAITRMEIEGVVYRGSIPRISTSEFLNWLDYQSSTLSTNHDLGCRDLELLTLSEHCTTADTVKESIRLYSLMLVSILTSILILCMIVAHASSQY